MLQQLKFVMGSVSKKELIQSLSHFKIKDQRVYGYNGKLGLSAPIPFEIDCYPKATQLVNAIDKCEEAVQLGMTPKGRLSVKSGKFRSYVDCLPEDGNTPHVEPEGEVVDLDGEALMKALKLLQPFVADDAARPWSNGVLLKGNSAYATNNVIFVEYWMGVTFPCDIVIPRNAIKEMLRIKQKPVRFQMTDNSLTVHYEDGCWLRTNLINSGWPDPSKLFTAEANPVPFPEGFYEALDSVNNFTDKFGRIMFDNGVLYTHNDDEMGAKVEIAELVDKGSYVVTMLQKLQGVANTIDFSHYPNPCPWYGDNVRGVIIGLRWLEELNV